MWCCGPPAAMRSSVGPSHQRTGSPNPPGGPSTAPQFPRDPSTPSQYPSRVPQYPGLMASTLVETVSLNYEDFSEYFLTCGTCLCTYDGGDHVPKLLPCSHTVCLHCLSRIVSPPRGGDGGSSSPRGGESFRCPICREHIRIPTGGVAALPPSFLVNQLLDLMATQRREVVPKCSLHSTQELLFCESCDLVFCNECTDGQHGAPSPTTGGGEPTTSSTPPHHHTVVPLATAVRRTGEILCYKAELCYAKLNRAREAVAAEMAGLEVAVAAALDDVTASFDSLLEVVGRRRVEVAAAVAAVRDAKRSVLEEQLSLIEAERERIQAECAGLQCQVEVRNITQRIARLNTKMDALCGLCEPRENCYVSFDATPALHSSLCSALDRYGRVATSRTLPSLSSLSVPPAGGGGQKPVCHLRTHVLLRTVDFTGHPQVSGGDPVEAEVRCGDSTLPCHVTDNGDGSYNISFTPTTVGTHSISASIFGRPVRHSPLSLEVGGDHNPYAVYGGRGSGPHSLLQPAALCVHQGEPSTPTGSLTPTGTLTPTGSLTPTVGSGPSLSRSGGGQAAPAGVTVFVADTGNCRIKVLNRELEEQHHLVGEALSGRGVTGLALAPTPPDGRAPNLLLVNWRHRRVTELTQRGEIVQQFTHDLLREPTSIAVTPLGEVLVGDGCRVLVFSPNGGDLISCWGERGTADGKMGDLAALCAVPAPPVAGGAADGGGDEASGGSGDPSQDPPCEVVVADHRLQVFSLGGSYLRTLCRPPGGARGRYGGLCIDSNGLLLASRQEGSCSCVQVVDYALGTLIYSIDSPESRLRRPAGLGTTADGWVFVVDIAACCVKLFRYR